MSEPNYINSSYPITDNFIHNFQTNQMIPSNSALNQIRFNTNMMNTQYYPQNTMNIYQQNLMSYYVPPEQMLQSIHIPGTMYNPNAFNLLSAQMSGTVNNRNMNAGVASINNPTGYQENHQQHQVSSQHQQHQQNYFNTQPQPTNQSVVAVNQQNLTTSQHCEEELSAASQKSTQSARKKNVLSIRDPTTGEEINLHTLNKPGTTPTNSTSTSSVSARSTSEPLAEHETAPKSISSDNERDLAQSTESLTPRQDFPQNANQISDEEVLKSDQISKMLVTPSEDLLLSEPVTPTLNPTSDIFQENLLEITTPAKPSFNGYRYDRTALLEIAMLECSQKRPENFKEIADVTRSQIALIPDEKFFELLENLSKRSNFTKGSLSSRPSTKMASFKHTPSFKQQNSNEPKIINLDSKIVLKETEHSFKPSFRSTVKISEDEALKRKILVILNKLTPENYELIKKNILELNLTTYDQVMTICQSIFEKATKEKSYTEVFAILCRDLQQKLQCYVDNSQISLRAIIIKFCQSQFEITYEDYIAKNEEDHRIQIENETNEEIKQFLINNTADIMKKKQDQYFGNIRFIGELLKVQVLKFPIFFICSKQLIAIKSTMALDCLYQLCSNCGKYVDVDKYRNDFDNVFKFIQEMSTNNDIESRIRFKMMEIVDMRRRNWKKRDIHEKLDNKPKTLLQEKEILDREKSEEQKKILSRVNSENSMQSSYSKTLVNPMKLVVNTRSAEPTSFFGPNNKNISKWSQGSSSKDNKEKSKADGSASNEGWIDVDKNSRANKPKNMTQNSNRSNSPVIMNTNRFTSKLAQSGRSTPVLTESNSFPNAMPISGCTLDTGSNSSIPSTVDESSNLGSSTMIDKDTIDNTIKRCLDGYIACGKLDEEEISILLQTDSGLVEKLIEFCLEKNETFIEKAGGFLAKLVSEKHITLSSFIEGLNIFLVDAPSLIADYPKLWNYFGLILSAFIENQDSDILFFNELKIEKNVKNGGTLLYQALETAAKRLGHSVVGLCFRKSGLCWEKLLPSEEVEDFLNKNNLTYTKQRFRHDSISVDSLRTEFTNLSSSNNDVILDFIDERIEEEEKTSQKFLEVLVEFVFNGCFENGEYYSTRLVNRYPLFKRFSDNSLFLPTLSKQIGLMDSNEARSLLIDDLISSHLIQPEDLESI